MTPKQKQNYNQMINALRRIKAYDSPEKLKKNSQKDWGLEYEEALKMSYENIQNEANVVVGISEIKDTIIRTLNVKKTTRLELSEKWGVPLPPHWHDHLLHIRCNAKGIVNWENAPVFLLPLLKKRGNYKIHE
jgi:hypothetical protein